MASLKRLVYLFKSDETLNTEQTRYSIFTYIITSLRKKIKHQVKTHHVVVKNWMYWLLLSICMLNFLRLLHVLSNLKRCVHEHTFWNKIKYGNLYNLGFWVCHVCTYMICQGLGISEKILDLFFIVQSC